jgi:MoxR-like ATPase
VATANPFNRQASQEIEEATKQRLLWYLAPPADIIAALRKVFR